MNYNNYYRLPQQPLPPNPRETAKRAETARLKRLSNGVSLFAFSYLVATVTLSSVLSIVFMILSKGLFYDYFDSDSSTLELFAASVSIAAPLAVAVFYCLISKTSMRKTVPVRRVKQRLLWPCVIMGLGTTLSANAISNLFVNNLSFFGISNSADLSVTINSPFDFVVMMVTTAVVPAFIEEFAFRGIIMGSLRKYGDAFAIIVSSIIFGAFHGNIVQIPFAFVSGLAFGFVVCKTNSLVTSIIIHFLNNAYAVVFNYLITDLQFNSRLMNSLNEVVFAALIIFGLAAFFITVKKRGDFFKIDSDTCLAEYKGQTYPLSLKEKISAYFTSVGTVVLFSALILLTVGTMAIDF